MQCHLSLPKSPLVAKLCVTASGHFFPSYPYIQILLELERGMWRCDIPTVEKGSMAQPVGGGNKTNRRWA